MKKQSKLESMVEMMEEYGSVHVKALVLWSGATEGTVRSYLSLLRSDGTVERVRRNVWRLRRSWWQRVMEWMWGDES